MLKEYKYYPFKSCNKYTKRHDNHEEDMGYRYCWGKMIYTLQEIVELWEINLITNY